MKSKEPPFIEGWDLLSIPTARWFLVLRIFPLSIVESKRSLPPVRDWMEISETLCVSDDSKIKRIFVVSEIAWQFLSTSEIHKMNFF